MPSHTVRLARIRHMVDPQKQGSHHGIRDGHPSSLTTATVSNSHPPTVTQVLTKYPGAPSGSSGSLSWPLHVEDLGSP
jgi:hypothetical protein